VGSVFSNLKAAYYDSLTLTHTGLQQQQQQRVMVEFGVIVMANLYTAAS
jgi:hypothetical protein